MMQEAANRVFAVDHRVDWEGGQFLTVDCAKLRTGVEIRVSIGRLLIYSGGGIDLSTRGSRSRVREILFARRFRAQSSGVGGCATVPHLSESHRYGCLDVASDIGIAGWDDIRGWLRLETRARRLYFGHASRV